MTKQHMSIKTNQPQRVVMIYFTVSPARLRSKLSGKRKKFVEMSCARTLASVRMVNLAIPVEKASDRAKVSRRRGESGLTRQYQVLQRLTAWSVSADQ
jgi:hypothetical protein